MPTFSVKLTKSVDKLQELLAQTHFLAAKVVLVGVPQDKTERTDTDKINNATIAYINEHGSPKQNIPARPFMRPAINAIASDVRDRLKKGAQGVLKGDKFAAERALNAVGLMGVSAIQRKMVEGPFQPLSPRTIEGRLRRRAAGRKLIQQIGASKAIATQNLAAMNNLKAIVGVKPLIDTGRLRRSINYVIRDRF